MVGPARVSDRLIDIGISLGYTFITEQGVSADEALRRADAALYRSKREGRNRATAFEVAEHPLGTPSSVKRELRRCWDEGRFELHYQPIVLDGGVVGVEALLRLQHPEIGEVGPSAFIGTLVESALARPIGTWVINEALTQLMGWIERGLVGPAFRMHVNVAPRQLGHADYVDDIIASVREHAIAPGRLAIEITEQSLLDLDQRSSSLMQLADSGIALYLDDFGTGASSSRTFAHRP